jgi:hypothetical protein
VPGRIDDLAQDVFALPPGGKRETRSKLAFHDSARSARTKCQRQGGTFFGSRRFRKARAWYFGVKFRCAKFRPNPDARTVARHAHTTALLHPEGVFQMQVRRGEGAA